VGVSTSIRISPSPVSKLINNFQRDCNLYRCDVSFPSYIKFTYINAHLNHFSKIDYILFDNVQVNAFEITDPDVNFSDHVLIIVECTVKMSVNIIRHSCSDSSPPLLAKRLHWDRADLNAYSSYTQKYLQPIISRLINIESEGQNLTDLPVIDKIDEDVVDALISSSDAVVPLFKQNFFKFWWNQEQDCL
jgi:hypothetical protein